MKPLRWLVVCFTLLLLAAPLTSGCGLFGELKEGLGQAIEVRDDIKDQLGVDSNVNFKINNGHKEVDVSLSTTPAGDAKDIKAKVEAIVTKRFGKVDEIRVTM